MTAGQAVYLDPADDRYKLADSNAAAAEARTVRGIALHGSLAGQPLTIHRSGDLTLGAVLTAGSAYYLSDTPGGICPVADVGTGEYVTLIGLAKTTSVLDVSIQNTGVVK